MPQVSDMPLRAGARPLCAAEITAVGAGRRLYQIDAIGASATVNTILCYTAILRPRERLALDQVGARSFGICARAGMLYQQAIDLLSELPALPRLPGPPGPSDLAELPGLPEPSDLAELPELP